MPSNMFRSKRGHSVTRHELAALNVARDVQAFYESQGAAGPFSMWPRADGERAAAEAAHKANIRMLADNVAHLKLLTRGH